MMLDQTNAIKIVAAAEIWSGGQIKAGGVEGVVLCLQYGKLQGSFRVISHGKVIRAGLRKMRASSAQQVVKALEAAGYEMID